jgi:hypothetical protein
MSTEELDSAMDSILGTNNQEDIWKDVKVLKNQSRNKFFYLQQNVEHRFRLLGPALHTERIYLPLNVYKQLIGPGASSDIVSKKDIPSIKLLLSHFFRALPNNDKLHIENLQEMKDVIAFLYTNRSHKSCQAYKNEINPLYNFLSNEREGWQKCTLINAVSLGESFNIKILPLIQTLKKSIKCIINKKKKPFRINGICAKDIIIQKNERNERNERNEGRNNRRGEQGYNPTPARYNIQSTPALTNMYPAPAFTYFTTGWYSTNPLGVGNPNDDNTGTIAPTDPRFNTETTVSFSDKEYFLPDNIINYILREGLLDIKKIINTSNQEGRHVFYYRIQDDYKMPKEYMKELMEEVDDKMAQDCLDGIEENMEDLPEDAIEKNNQNNSMSNLKLNFDE